MANIDFSTGIKSAFTGGVKKLRKDNLHVLEGKSRWLGADAKVLGLEKVGSYKFGTKNYNFDLTRPGTEALRILDDMGIKDSDVARADIIRNVLTGETKKWGKKLLRWSSKNEWAHLQENWHKMMMGTIIMNGNDILDDVVQNPGAALLLDGTALGEYVLVDADGDDIVLNGNTSDPDSPNDKIVHEDGDCADGNLLTERIVTDSGQLFEGSERLCSETSHGDNIIFEPYDSVNPRSYDLNRVSVMVD